MLRKHKITPSDKFKMVDLRTFLFLSEFSDDFDFTYNILDTARKPSFTGNFTNRGILGKFAICHPFSALSKTSGEFGVFLL